MLARFYLCLYIRYFDLKTNRNYKLSNNISKKSEVNIKVKKFTILINPIE